jgi:hypothetical protein
MNNQVANRLPVSGDSSTHSATITRLHEIIERFEDFMIAQLERLDSEIRKLATEVRDTLGAPEGLPAAPSGSDPASEHEEAMRCLCADAERLIAAWQELEAEQRRLLASRSIQQLRVGVPTHSTTDILSKTPSSLVPRRASSGVAPGQNPSDGPLRQPIALDQLQRQVRAHARRN